jgi:hypothetical protein
MKHMIRLALVTALASVVCSCIAYRVASRNAFKRGYETGFNGGRVDMIAVETRGTSVVLGDALRKIRSGDTAEATHELEDLYFASAESFFHLGTTNETAKMLAREVVQYRGAYRTNSADWDVIERKLEVELTRVR